MLPLSLQRVSTSLLNCFPTSLRSQIKWYNTRI
jgi:hypothetical protein